MKFKSVSWWKAAAALLAAACLLAGSRDMIQVKSAEKKTEEMVGLDQKLGVEPGAVLAELSAHQQDGYYLGTPYVSYPLTEENCMRPNGEYGGDGGMNCTGFVASVLEKCGADLSGIAARGYPGGKVNASNWYHWMEENAVKSYHFDTVRQLLASGMAQKGDVIYFEPVSWEEEGADCHIGFFWGESPQDNVFWHSAVKPERMNQISAIEPKSPSTVYLFKITHTGKLQLRKSSAGADITEGNRVFSLAGAEYGVYPAGSEEPVAVMVTDENGSAEVRDLEEGTYEVREIQAPPGYTCSSQSASVTVRTGETVFYDCQDSPVLFDAGMLLQKVDAQTGQPQPQGAGTLGGAVFQVCYYDVYTEEDPGKKGETPLRIWEFTTGEQGEIYFTSDYQSGGDPLYRTGEKTVIPPGTVTIREIKPPEGYTLQEKTEVILLNAESETGEEAPVFSCVTVEEQGIRGDLRLVKAAAGTLERMAEIPFRITSRTTGESHVIWTDENGTASTEAAWNSHCQNTNRGEKAEDGVWFGEGEPDDRLGALFYDTYEIEELPAENNRGKILIPPFEVVIARDQVTVDLGTLTNEAEPVLEIRTLAADSRTGEKEIKAGENVELTDTVTYSGLEPGKVCRLEGILMDRESGEPVRVNGSPVRGETVFTPEESQGSVSVTFRLDAAGLEGRSIVVFEELFVEEELAAAHQDLEDEGQTITFFPGQKEKPDTVKTGDVSRLTLLIVSLILSCAVIVKCGRITLRKK